MITIIDSPERSMSSQDCFIDMVMDVEKLMKDMGANTEQMIAVRNYLKKHPVKDKTEIQQHMPSSLNITPQVVKLALAMIHHEYI